tara:strand:+ start:158 stop:310 length:153 start_codon:yes stop_codon:yes gene_type:complete
MYGKRKGMKHGGKHRKPMGGGGYSMNKKRKMYKHGGVAHGGEAMPKAKPC